MTTRLAVAIAVLISSCCREPIEPTCGTVVFMVTNLDHPDRSYIAVATPPNGNLVYLSTSPEQQQVAAGDWFCGYLFPGAQPFGTP